MPLTLNDNEVIEHKFSISFFKFTQSFNYLDRNLGLCIACLTTTNNPNAAYRRLEGLTTYGKMDCLEKLIFDRFHKTSIELVNQFDQWFKKASQKRIARNDFIHGTWDIGLPGDKTIRFNPNTWKTDARKSQTFSLNEFEEIAQDMEDLFQSFMVLRKKIG